MEKDQENDNDEIEFETTEVIIIQSENLVANEDKDV